VYVLGSARREAAYVPGQPVVRLRWAEGAVLDREVIASVAHRILREDSGEAMPFDPCQRRGLVREDAGGELGVLAVPSRQNTAVPWASRAA